MARKSYPTDLKDEEWEIIKPLIPEKKPGGRPQGQEIREVVNAIFYILRAGCAWSAGRTLESSEDHLVKRKSQCQHDLVS